MYENVCESYEIRQEQNKIVSHNNITQTLPVTVCNATFFCIVGTVQHHLLFL